MEGLQKVAMPEEVKQFLNCDPATRLIGSEYTPEDAEKIPKEKLSEFVEVLLPLLRMYPDIPCSAELKIVWAVLTSSPVGSCNRRILTEEEVVFFEDICDGDNADFEVLKLEHSTAEQVIPFLKPFQKPQCLGDFLDCFIPLHPFKRTGVGGNLEVYNKLMKNEALLEFVLQQPPREDMSQVLESFLGRPFCQGIISGALSFADFQEVMEKFIQASLELSVPEKVAEPLSEKVVQTSKAKAKPNAEGPKKKRKIQQQTLSDLVDSEEESNKPIRPKKKKGPPTPKVQPVFVEVKTEPVD